MRVFFDANIIIQTGKPPGGPMFNRLVDLVNGEFIQVVTTDITLSEVAKKHVENDYDIIKEIGRPYFRKLAKEMFDVDIPETSKNDIRDALFKKYQNEVETMFQRLGAKVLKVDDTKPSSVFSAYAHKTGVFSGDAKKDQFPDAFIFECLKTEASVDAPILVVSNDGDFATAIKSADEFSLVKDIKGLFQQLGLEIESPVVDDFIEKNIDVLSDIAEAELENWSLEATDVMDAYLEQEGVTEFELVDITAFQYANDDQSIFLIGSAAIKVEVSYTHPDWDTAMWDSEDKVAIPFEEVSGVTDVSLNIDFSVTLLLDEDGDPTEFDDFQVRHDGFVWVELHPYDPWEYM